MREAEPNAFLTEFQAEVWKGRLSIRLCGLVGESLKLGSKLSSDLAGLSKTVLLLEPLDAGLCLIAG